MAMLRAFLGGTAKIALALTLAATMLLLGVWGFVTWQSRAKAMSEAPLAVKKQWPTRSILANLPVDVATAWRNGQTYYQVTISDYSEERYSRDSSALLNLQFNDNDGFRLWEKRIKLDEMTTLTGADGNGAIGFSWAGDEFLTSEQYSRGTNLEVVWSGLNAKVPLRGVAYGASDRLAPVLPKPPRPSWMTTSNWRGLTVGMPEEGVRKLLGEPTNVVRYGSALYNWRYGDIVSGGEVSFRGTTVVSWREPDR